MPPTVCKPLNVPSGFVLTGLLKNQKPMSFDPLTAVRSAPKKRNSWPPTAGSTYFAANPSVMASASGPDESVCLQLLMSRSSFEPPVVKTLCPSGSWIQSHAVTAEPPVQFGPEQGFGLPGPGEPFARTAA